MLGDGPLLWLLCDPLDSVIVMNTNAIFMFMLTQEALYVKTLQWRHIGNEQGTLGYEN